MIILNLEQGSPEWKEWRRGMITASDMPAIMGYKRYGKTVETVYREKRSIPDKIYDSPAMKRGRERESEVRKMFEAMMGCPCKPSVIASEHTPWAGASLDGFNERKRIGGEFKCPTAPDDHDLALEGIVPMYYLPQVQWQMYVSGFETWEYASYRPESKHEYAQIKVLRNEMMIEEMLEKGKWFKSCVDERINPIDEVWIDDHVRHEKIEKLQEAIIIKKQSEQLIEQLKDELIPTFEGKRARGGDLIFDPVETKGNVDYSRIPQLAGVNLDEYRKDSYIKWMIRLPRNV